VSIDHDRSSDNPEHVKGSLDTTQFTIEDGELTMAEQESHPSSQTRHLTRLPLRLRLGTVKGTHGAKGDTKRPSTARDADKVMTEGCQIIRRGDQPEHSNDLRKEILHDAQSQAPGEEGASTKEDLRKGRELGDGPIVGEKIVHAAGVDDGRLIMMVFLLFVCLYVMRRGLVLKTNASASVDTLGVNGIRN
jgi:hypothetical protein